MTSEWHLGIQRRSPSASQASLTTWMPPSFGVATGRPTSSKVRSSCPPNQPPRDTPSLSLPLWGPIGDQYWRFDSKSDPPVSNKYPKPIKNWVGLPSSVDAAFKWENGMTYFFKDIYYYRFNDADFEVNESL